MLNSISNKLWSLYQINPAPKYVSIHQTENPFLINTRSLFLRFCIFEDIADQAISLSGEIPAVIDSTSFYQISYELKSACFEMNLIGSASAALIKVCFVACKAQRYGSGTANVAKRATVINQCAIANFNDPNQYDALRIIGPDQQIESINSTQNSIINCPLLSSDESIICNCRMAIAVNNHPKSGICYFANADVKVYMCSFVDNEIDILTNHGVLSFYYTNATVTCCDFIRNKGPMLLNSYSNSVFKNCLFEGNPEPTGSGVRVIESVDKSNVFQTWAMRADDCHFHKKITIKKKQKSMLLMAAFALS